MCLGYADLRGVQFDDASFTLVDNGWMALKGANLECASLRRTKLPGMRLMEADLRGTDFQGANLVGTDLSGANLEGANLQGADLRLPISNGRSLSVSRSTVPALMAPVYMACLPGT